jgi:hypothetical protein
MNAAGPFARIDREAVLGSLRAAGSRDPDLLHAQKLALLRTVRFPKLAGTSLIAVGALSGAGLGALSARLAAVGIPVLLAGWWLRRRGARNVATVEATYAEFLRAPAQPWPGAKSG